LNVEALNSMHLVFLKKVGQVRRCYQKTVGQALAQESDPNKRRGWRLQAILQGMYEFYRTFLAGQLGKNAISKGSSCWWGEELQNLRGKGFCDNM